jgi:hypothetical protein
MVNTRDVVVALKALDVPVAPASVLALPVPDRPPRVFDVLVAPGFEDAEEAAPFSVGGAAGAAVGTAEGKVATLLSDADCAGSSGGRFRSSESSMAGSVGGLGTGRTGGAAATRAVGAGATTTGAAAMDGALVADAVTTGATTATGAATAKGAAAANGAAAAPAAETVGTTIGLPAAFSDGEGGSKLKPGALTAAEAGNLCV